MHAFFLAWVFAAGLQPEQSLKAEFDAGCQAFDAGQFERAAAAFQSLKVQRPDSGWLSYNLGNSHLKAGHLGRAIACFRQALADLPRHSDIRANLAFARRRATDAVAPVEPLPLLRSLFFWHYVLSLRESLWVAGWLMALFWLARGGVLLRYHRRALALAGGVCGICGMALMGSVGVHLVYPEHVAVVLEDELDVHTINNAQAPVRFRLHTGCETKMHAQLDGWVLIALSDGKQGWVPRHSVAVVAL